MTVRRSVKNQERERGVVNKRKSIRNIWMLTREYGELAGAGGVKDVAAQLAKSMAKWTGRQVSVVMPLYGFITPEKEGFTRLTAHDNPADILSFSVEMNYVGQERREDVSVWYGRQDRVHIYLLESDRFSEKEDVYTYTANEERSEPGLRQGEGHFDFFAMNLLLQKAALQLILLLRQVPDVIHCHDGHTAVIPALIREIPWLNSYFNKTACLVTIHNAGEGYHQEVADLPYAHAMTGLPWSAIMKSRLQGRFDPLVCAGLYGAVNTVSENYARELQESNNDSLTGWLGHHLQDLGVNLTGITNGIEPSQFDPSMGADIGLEASYEPGNPEKLDGKGQCRTALIRSLSNNAQHPGLDQYGFLRDDGDVPLFSFIGRLSPQKGIDVLLEAMLESELRGQRFQLVILGRGTATTERQIRAITESDIYTGRVCFLSGYNSMYANRVYSGGDFFLIPSRYEPCGLTDFIAQLFGNLPIVHHIGGLVKVVDGETGFSYGNNIPSELALMMRRAIEFYQDKESLVAMQKNAIERIHRQYTWDKVKSRYLQLYRSVWENL